MNNCFRSARSLANAIRNKKLSSETLANEHLAQIKKYNESIKALRVVNSGNALVEAKAADAHVKTGLPAGRLHGVFYSAKDHIEVAGLSRSDGSKASETANDVKDSFLAALLRSEGAICLGKGNMAEYGKSYFTDNRIYGRTNNPFSSAHSPGGSSGGDAAAVAAGLVDFALAADAGGSVRIPASFCGIFGLHPTPGTFSENTSGHAISNLFRTYGVMSRHLEDIAILQQILIAPDPLDSKYSPFPINLPKNQTKTFAYFTEINGVKCDGEIVIGMEKAVAKLEAEGWKGIETTPAPFAGAYEIFIILAGQTALLLEDLLSEAAGNPRDLANESPHVSLLRSRIATELPALTVEKLLACWNRVFELRANIGKVFQEYDFVLSPVAASLAPPHSTSMYEVKDKDGTIQQLYSQQVYQFSTAINVLSLPAIAFPTHLSKSKLPVGLQIIGPRFGDRDLIDVLRSADFTTGLVPEIVVPKIQNQK